MGIICDGFYFYAEKGIEQGIIGVYGNNNQTLGIWHDSPEYVGNLDECTTIDTAISKKCKSLLQKGMKTLDGTYGQIAVIDAQNGRLKAWVALEKKDNGFSDAKLLRLLYRRQHPHRNVVCRLLPCPKSSI